MLQGRILRVVTLVGFIESLKRAVDDGLTAAALVDRDGNTIACAGEITNETAMPLVALVMYRLKSEDLAPRLFAGEILQLELEERMVAVAVAKRQLFVVATFAVGTAATRIVRELRDDVARLLVRAVAEGAAPTWGGGGTGGSGSGPAELPLIELGITVPRTRGKA